MQGKRSKNLLAGTRVYLSGPMDFVASRAKEKKFGWRNRISQYLHQHGATVFDPWNKPEVRGFHQYGKEDEKTIQFRETWTFDDTLEGAVARSECANQFRETLHIDLRMVDISDFVIAYCPTNIYSVGTPHEIVLARQQSKPVLFVSPPVQQPSLEALKSHLANDNKAAQLLNKLADQVPIKENPNAIPSLWYMPLVGAHNFFDGFGFGMEKYQKPLKWDREKEPDPNEKEANYKRPLLPFLDDLVQGKYPQKWDHKLKIMVPDDDWLLLDSSIRLER